MERPIVKKVGGATWLLWWKIDSDDLDEQVTNYGTMRFYKSMRGVSVLLLTFSIAVTTLFIVLGASDPTSFVDIGLMAILALFIYLGHRWAMIAAMVLWSFEKAILIVAGFSAGGAAAGQLIAQILWWTVYMHAFYFAFRIEGERKNRTAAISVF